MRQVKITPEEKQKVLDYICYIVETNERDDDGEHYHEYKCTISTYNRNYSFKSKTKICGYSTWKVKPYLNIYASRSINSYYDFDIYICQKNNVWYDDFERGYSRDAEKYGKNQIENLLRQINNDEDFEEYKIIKFKNKIDKKLKDKGFTERKVKI